MTSQLATLIHHKPVSLNRKEELVLIHLPQRTMSPNPVIITSSQLEYHNQLYITSFDYTAFVRYEILDGILYVYILWLKGKRFMILELFHL
jgi:hypothetical protein